MKEIEVKAKVSSFDEIKEKLTALGSKFSEPLIQKDKIFLHKSTPFSEIKRGDIILRIRDSNGKIILNLKKQLENELDNIEREVVINDSKQAEEILNYMDFHVVVNVTKKRIKCKYKDLEICLDDVEQLGSFIEVEKLTTEADSLKIQKELFEFLETLGVQKSDQVFKGYDTLIYELKNHF